MKETPTGPYIPPPRITLSKTIESSKEMFGEVPKPFISPLEKNDQPEIDTSEELDALGIKQYQSLLRALQWLGC